MSKSDDTISRQDAIEAVEAKAKWFNGDAIEDRCKRDAFISVIDDVLTELPSADRQEVESATINNEGITFSYRKTGEWKQISPAKVYECSKCGQNVMTNDIEAYKFCHGCGAKMRGESE